TIPIADLHRLPDNTPHIETVLERGELITAVNLPKPIAGVHLYRKVRDRASYAFATISLALIARVEGGRVKAERLAFGGLAHQPWRVKEAELVSPDGHAYADRIADVAL